MSDILIGSWFLKDLNKNYRILQQVLPLTLAENLDQIWGICSHLTLFLSPISKEQQSLDYKVVCDYFMCREAIFL